MSTEGGGSQKGIEAAVAGSAQIGTSDAFMSSEQAGQHPDILNIAMAISAQTVNYNLPGLTQPLKLDGPTLVGIYTGKIRSWDDRAIAALNPGVSLPHHEIVPLHRADGSGDTFVFTQYLSFTTEPDQAIGFFTQAPSWQSGPGYGTTVTWPKVEGEQTATGNDGMVEALQKTPYSVGYVGVSFADKVKAAGLGAALVKSNSGEFLLPTPDTILAAAASLTPRTPDDERLSLVNAPGRNCYPLINYEYAMVSKKSRAMTAGPARCARFWRGPRHRTRPTPRRSTRSISSLCPPISGSRVTIRSKRSGNRLEKLTPRYRRRRHLRRMRPSPAGDAASQPPRRACRAGGGAAPRDRTRARA